MAISENHFHAELLPYLFHSAVIIPSIHWQWYTLLLISSHFCFSIADIAFDCFSFVHLCSPHSFVFVTLLKSPRYHILWPLQFQQPSSVPSFSKLLYEQRPLVYHLGGCPSVLLQTQINLFPLLPPTTSDPSCLAILPQYPFFFFFF